MSDDMSEVVGGRTGDSPPPGTETWKAETKAIERVIQIALTLDQPQSVGWIADEAAVAEQTARDHLGVLVNLGVVAKTEARGVTKFRLDVGYMRYREVSRLIEKHDKDDLLSQAADIQSRIEDAKTEYGVDTPDELRQLATDEGVAVETVRDYKMAASEWETLEHQLDVIDDAIDRYDEFSRGRVTA
jgi:predicted ArsR family transcriptional regulator